MEKTGLFNHALKWGLIIGIVNIILTILVYIIGEGLMIKWWFGLSILVINIILIVYAGKQYRTAIGGYMSFNKAFSVVFMTLVVAGIITTLFNIILYQVIDPDLPNRLTQAALEQAEQMMARFNMPADQMDEALAQAEERTAGQFSVTGSIKGFGISLIFYLVVSLIIGAIIKRKEKEEEVM